MTEIASENAVAIKAGTKLITENELSQKMYIIVKGKARVFKTYLGQRITLAVLGDGEIFGEMSFIDAEPRSASVEALTDMKVIVVDGAKDSEQLKNLPSWVWTIFRTVFYRFRSLDREVVSLQSAVSYRKKGLKQDVVASTVYLEMLRFLKAINLIEQSHQQLTVRPSASGFLEELDGVLGGKAIGLRPFWKLLQEYDFIDNVALAKSKEVHLIRERLTPFESYLEGQIKKEEYLMLSHGALSVIRRIVGCLEHTGSTPQKDEALTISCEQLRIRNIPDHEAATQELSRLQVIPFKDKIFQVKPGQVHQLYIYQSILKHFDHSAIYVD